MERLSKMQKCILEKLDSEDGEGIEIQELWDKVLEDGIIISYADFFNEIPRLKAKNLVALLDTQKYVITVDGKEKLKFISGIKDIVYSEPLGVVAIIISIVSLISGLIKG
ncbi:MAG: hypothetical protein Q8O41_03685 [Candidatus Methanoperedens sp.]|nr:hypothetical protein [Candidatus Methanoperedens sp.]